MGVRRAAEAIRLGGWVYSSRRLDALVERLDTIAAASATTTAGATTAVASAMSSPERFDIWTAQLFELTHQDSPTGAAPPTLEDLLDPSAVHADLIDSFAYLPGSDLAPEKLDALAPPAFEPSSQVGPSMRAEEDDIGGDSDSRVAPVVNFHAGLGTKAPGPSMWPEQWPDSSVS